MTASALSVISSFALGLLIGVYMTGRLAKRDHHDDMRDSIHYRPEELYDDDGRKYYEAGYDVRDGGEWE